MNLKVLIRHPRELLAAKFARYLLQERSGRGHDELIQVLHGGGDVVHVGQVDPRLDVRVEAQLAAVRVWDVGVAQAASKFGHVLLIIFVNTLEDFQNPYTANTAKFDQ